MPEVRTLPSAGITRFRQYYDPLRLLCGPPCLPRRWVLPGHDRSPPVTRIAFTSVLCPLPRRTRMGARTGSFPIPRGLPRYPVGSASALLLSRPAQASRVTAHWLAQPPKGDLCHKAPARSVTRTSRLSATRSNRFTIEVESSSTGNTHPRGALGKIACTADVTMLSATRFCPRGPTKPRASQPRGQRRAPPS
jgi:hypothetical protein